MSHPQHKTDNELGMRVRAHLESKGIETPMIASNLTREQKIRTIEDHFGEIMETLGLDLHDDSLADTPTRVAKMYVDEIFYGLDYSQFPKCTAIENKMNYNDSFVLETGVNIQSNCEHHFVIIDGNAAIAYIPNKKVLGLSKLNRIAEFFAKRPQVQERLTEQIRETIAFIAETDDVIVYLSAVHFCVKSRGIQDTGSTTTTLSAGGVFQTNPGIRSEFLNLARTQR